MCMTSRWITAGDTSRIMAAIGPWVPLWLLEEDRPNTMLKWTGTGTCGSQVLIRLISIDEDRHGFIWAATGRGAVRLDRETKEFAEFISLTPGLVSYGMAGDHDGNGWWTEFNSTNWCLGLQ